MSVVEIFALMTLAASLFNAALIASYMHKTGIAVVLHWLGGVEFLYVAVRFVMMTW